MNDLLNMLCHIKPDESGKALTIIYRANKGTLHPKYLGILVNSQFGGVRVINEEEAARAMRIFDSASLDIRKKAIWRERAGIMSGLKDVDLKTWIEKKK